MFSFQLDIKTASWMSNPAERWNAGLERAGLEFRQSIQISQYPPIPPNSTYQRTGTTAHKAGFRVTSFGQEMVFGSTDYLIWLLIPARTVKHWEPVRPKMIKRMSDGFAKGVKDFKRE
jgi:hypothetical protein